MFTNNNETTYSEFSIIINFSASVELSAVRGRGPGLGQIRWLMLKSQSLCLSRLLDGMAHVGNTMFQPRVGTVRFSAACGTIC